MLTLGIVFAPSPLLLALRISLCRLYYIEWIFCKGVLSQIEAGVGSETISKVGQQDREIKGGMGMKKELEAFMLRPFSKEEFLEGRNEVLVPEIGRWILY